MSGLRPRKARLAAALALLTLLACTHPEERFESNVQLVSRRDVVTSAPKGGQPGQGGEVTVVDLELEWDPCPGDQYQYVRGGKAFAACTSRYQVGDYLPVRVVRYWDTRGYYRWDIYRVGDCPRDVEIGVEGSFERSQECTPHKMQGEVAGFDCNRRAPKRLVAVCPWLARH